MIPVTITNTGMVTVSVRYSGLTNGASAPDDTDHAGFDDHLLGRGCGPIVPMQSCIVNIGFDTPFPPEVPPEDFDFGMQTVGFTFTASDGTTSASIGNSEG
jgi:hypothetical protein